MKNPFRITLCLLLSQLISLNNMVAQDWVQLFNDSLRFSVESPELLVEKENVAMTEVGNLVINSFGYLPTEGDIMLYQVIVMNYPKGSLPIDSVELRTVMLSELVEQSASANEADVIYKQELQEYGLVGIQWRVHSGKEIAIKSKAFIYQDRIYIAQVMSKQNRSLNTNVNKFLDRFRIYTN